MQAITGVLAGVVAAVLAGALPVVRSSRTPPLAALRELAAEPPRVSRLRVAAGGLTLAAGVTAVIAGAASASQGAAVTGAVATVAGLVVLGPAAARPAVTVLGAPIAVMRGVSGRLARDNALRNPRRTAATASALLIGVAVAALFTVVGASMKATAASGIDHTLTADLVVDRGGYGGASSGGGLSPQLAASLGRLTGVRLATGLARGNAVLGGQSREITTADPASIGQGPARAACTVDTRIRVLANTGALACTPRRLTTWPLS